MAFLSFPPISRVSLSFPNPSLSILNVHSKSSPQSLSLRKAPFFRALASKSGPNAPKSRPLSSLITILRCCSGFLQSRMLKVRSWMNGGLGDGQRFEDLAVGGGLGMVLMSTTAALTRERVSPFLCKLAENPTFVSGLMAWAVAQSLKMFVNFCVERRWNLGLMCSSGGMPSSHSALCMALTASVGLCHGVGDSLFPVCLWFSLIVMYDAIGVRRHAGIQAEVLNKIIEDLFQGHPISERKLKELLGHTPSQVIAGAFIGIFVAWFFCQGYFVAL